MKSTILILATLLIGVAASAAEAKRGRGGHDSRSYYSYNVSPQFRHRHARFRTYLPYYLPRYIGRHRHHHQRRHDHRSRDHHYYGYRR